MTSIRAVSHRQILKRVLKTPASWRSYARELERIRQGAGMLGTGGKVLKAFLKEKKRER